MPCMETKRQLQEGWKVLRGGRGMTNLEKWKYKIFIAKDSHKLLETLDEMERAMALSCRCCVDDNADCKECEARWLDMEVEE